MSLDIYMLENQALNLNFEARMRLAEKLIMSLDTSFEKNNLQFWVMEAEKRLKALREGRPKNYYSNLHVVSPAPSSSIIFISCSLSLISSACLKFFSLRA